jgi:ABC-type transport system involved in multi-copper enzyme maturation permease subunit
MIGLIKKDLKLSIKINLIAVIYVLFISVNGLLSKDLLIGNIIYVLSIIIFTFVVVIYVNGFDDKYKSEVILNSFPLDRRNIVRSKYITLIIFILISSAVIVALTNVLPMLLNIDGRASANIHTVIIAANVLLLFYSIYYPIYFKVGEGLRTFNTILWLLLVIGPNLLVKALKTLDQRKLLEILAHIDLDKINLYLLGISLIIYYLSLQISKKIYVKKEF